MNTVNTHNNRDDEIDLMQLFFQLWNHRRIIIIVSLVFALLAVITSFVIPSKWKTEVQLMQPQSADISHFSKKYLGYRNIYNLNNIDKNINIDTNNFLYSFLIRESQNPVHQELLKDHPNWKKIRVAQADNKKGLFYLSIANTDKTVGQSNTGIQEYLSYLNEHTLNIAQADVDIKIQNLIAIIKEQQDSLKWQAEARRQYQIEELQLAYDVAKKAGIHHYVAAPDAYLAQDNAMPSSLFLQGQNYLMAQIKQIKESPMIYSDKYYLLGQQVDYLQNLLDDKELNASILKEKTFSYKLPVLDPKKTNLHPLLVGIIGLMVGMFCAIVYVFLSQMWQDIKNTESKK